MEIGLNSLRGIARDAYIQGYLDAMEEVYESKNPRECADKAFTRQFDKGREITKRIQNVTRFAVHQNHRGAAADL